MAKIAATEERTLIVSASVEEVYGFFSDPALLREETPDVERFERLGPGRARWVLAEKAEKGIRFQADYTVEYTGHDDDRVTWRTLAGNLDTAGEVRLMRLGNHETEIRYRETLAPDLPITPILATLFRPLVVREVRADIGRFLERVAHRFGGRGDNVGGEAGSQEARTGGAPTAGGSP
jgi:carbon monoxide dehydrogenase subunit G